MQNLQESGTFKIQVIPTTNIVSSLRVNDEEGIRKLVMDVFQNMWFVPVREHGREAEDDELLVTRASNITDVVVACSKDTGYEWFEQLLETVSCHCYCVVQLILTHSSLYFETYLCPCLNLNMYLFPCSCSGLARTRRTPPRRTLRPLRSSSSPASRSSTRSSRACSASSRSVLCFTQGCILRGGIG